MSRGWVGAVAMLLVGVLVAPAAAAPAPSAVEGSRRVTVTPLGVEEPDADYFGDIGSAEELVRELPSRLGESFGTEAVALEVSDEEGATGVEASVQGTGYDADGDGVEDLLGASYDHDTQTLTSFVWSGADGSEIRSGVVDVDDPSFYVALVAPDITGDGISDEIRVTLADFEESGYCGSDAEAPYRCERTYVWHVQAVSGRDGSIAWSRTVEGYSAVEHDGSTRTAEVRNGNDPFVHLHVLPAGDHDGDGTPDVVIHEMFARFVREGNGPVVTSGAGTATIIGREGTTLGSFDRELGEGIPQLHRVGDIVGDSAQDFVWLSRYQETEHRVECPLPDPSGALQQLGLCDVQELYFNRVQVDAVDGTDLNDAWTVTTIDRVTGSNVYFPVVFGEQDVTGDGQTDIVVGALGGSWTERDNNSAAHLMDGATGDVVWSRELPMYQEAEHVSDVDGDGDPDLVFGGGRFTSWWACGTDGCSSGVEVGFTSTAVEVETSDTVREHRDEVAGPPAEWTTTYAVQPGDLNGDGLAERGFGVAFARRDTPEGPLHWESTARVFDGGVDQRALLTLDGPGRRVWFDPQDVDGDGVREILERDQGHDADGPTTLRAIDATGAVRWAHPDASDVSAIGGLDGQGADFVAAHRLVEGSHHRTTIRRFDGTTADLTWVRELG